MGSDAAHLMILGARGGGSQCSSVRHLCPLGRDHDDPFHVISDVQGHMTFSSLHSFFITFQFFSVHSTNWGRHFFQGLSGDPWYSLQKTNLVFWGRPAV